MLGRAPAPVHQELEEDDKNTDKHGETEEYEAPPEHREAVGFSVRLLARIHLSWLKPISVPA